MRFLADAGQQYTSVGTPCLSMAEADARSRAAIDAEARASAEANAAKNAAAKLDRELREASAEDEAPAARENDRKSAVWGKSVSVRVDLGGRPHIKKKNR